MYCRYCGKEIPDDKEICPLCGNPVEADAPKEDKPADIRSGSGRKKRIHSQQDIEGKQVTDSIYLCQDGKYRWVYEMSMLKNPTILFTVWKVLGIAFGIVFLLMQFMDLFGGNLSVDGFLHGLTLFALLALVFLVISIIAYVIVAAMYGWKYVVLFEMDEKQIKHIQVSRQHKKAELLGFVTAMAGLKSHNPTAVGMGLQAAARSTSTSEFVHVKSIRSFPGRHVIKISQGLEHNQIYAEGADYDFALRYIISHCPNAKVSDEQP